VARDPAECHNLAREHPDLLREMITRWYNEADMRVLLAQQ
jgi:hypothetical protein